MDKKITFIVLSWNSDNYLRNCFDSIIAKCGFEKIDFEIIVIENGSRDNSVEIIKEYIKLHPKNINCIFFKSNKGTTYSRNFGLKKVDSPYVCILDSDTKLLRGNIVDILNYLEINKNVGIVAPKIWTQEGLVQNTVKKFPTFLQKIAKIPKFIFPIDLPDWEFYKDFPFENIREVDSAVSACWFFRKELIQDVGYLDENIFYSPEDLDYCLRVKKAGKKIVYFNALEVLHYTQQHSHKKPFSKISILHLKGLIYYYCKHGGWVKSIKF